MSTTYLMENEEEIERLERKTDAGVVERWARTAGLQPGMRVVDLCCGAGLTTSILAEVAGPEGSAVGIDFSGPRLEHGRARYGGPTTSFVQRDVRQPLTGVGPFDFAWVRFALEYFREEAFSIVSHLADVMAPGGIVCLVDLDHNCLNHFGLSPRLERALTSAVHQVETAGNFDPYAGRKLYSHLHRLGFEDLKVEAGAHHLIYGALSPVDEYNWTRKIEVIVRNRGIVLPGYDSAEAFLDDFLAFFRDPGRFTYTPVIACWGVKPA
jgi:ubiquinone/menaquinone biosynthesis C-methylase UbiE